jgi:hypothetical protein
MRFNPRALFARRILVSEGMTEVGMLNGLREFWPPRHEDMPCEHKGASVADGNGGQTVSIALGLAQLGYSVAVFRDSDVPLTEEAAASLDGAGIQVFEYGEELDSEHALFSAASDGQVQRLLEYAREERGVGKINDNLLAALDLGRVDIAGDFAVWELISAFDGRELRDKIAGVFGAKKWFKDQRIGRGLAPVAWDIAMTSPESPIALALAAAEAWLYA